MKSKLKKELVIPPKMPNQDLPCDFEPLSHPLGTGPTNKQSAYTMQCNGYDTCFTHGKIGQTRCSHNANILDK